MKLKILFALFLSTCVITLGNNNRVFQPQKTDKEIAPGKFIVKFKSPNSSKKVNEPAAADVASRYNVTSQRQAFANARNTEIKEKLNLDNVFIFETSIAADIVSITKEISKDPRVEYAEPIYKCDDEFVPNDPLYGGMYHLPQVSAEEAWDIQFGSEDVIVAIIDSGVDWDHEDLEDLIWINEDEIPDNGIDDDNNGFVDDIRGWDFVDEPRDIDPDPEEDFEDVDNDPTDYHGHGSHVAGIAAAASNNAIGIASLSGGATIMPVRIGIRTTDGNGSGYSDWMASAYIYAADNGAKITNLSYGNSGQVIIDAAFYAFLNGVLIVESAGNTDAISPSALGGQDWVISVGSVNQDDVKTYYSSYGDYVKVSAPGGELFVNNDTWGILSTIPYPVPHYPNMRYTKFQGTSMASPFVASLGALILSHEPDLSIIDLFSRIVGTADNIDDLNPDYVGQLGSGRINALRALTENVEAKPNFQIVGSSIDDASGNGNGLFDPGESITLNLTIRNQWQTAESVTAEIVDDPLLPVEIQTGSISLGDVAGILDTTDWERSIQVELTCPADVLPQTLNLVLNVSGIGFEQSIPYKLALKPSVLFIADFEQSENKFFDFSEVYFDALDYNGISYDYRHRLVTEPTGNIASHFMNYKSIIWACEWFFPTLDSLDRVFLRDFLNEGGSLFISGQDVGWELNESQDNSDISFYENYLKTKYQADDANQSAVFGIDGDPISDGLEMDFFQEKRDLDQQYPDIVDALNGSEVIFRYESGHGAATKYSGDYRVVNFGFGGFESITDESNRRIIMNRIVNWLSGIDYNLDRLPDSENLNEDYVVNLLISTAKNLASIKLYWTVEPGNNYQTMDMIDNGDGSYTANIPATNQEADVEYFVFVEAEDGSYIISEKNTFHVGVDNIPPTITLLSNPLRNSVNLKGPFPYMLQVDLSDNIGIDPESAKINYTVNDGTYLANPLEHILGDLFIGSFNFDEELVEGDKVSYYFSAWDISNAQNEAVSETYEYLIDTSQVVDDFEIGLSDWDLDAGWGLSSRNKSGEFSLSDSPDGFYTSNLNTSAAYLQSFDLTPYQYAAAKFYMRSHMENKDTLYLEVSSDNGNTWEKVLSYSKNSTSFRENLVDISEFTGGSFSEVQIRFRFESDDEGERDGVWIDDISVEVSKNPPTSVREYSIIPMQYALYQSYPNPFNPSTNIKYAIPFESKVKVQIFDILGQLIDTPVNAAHSPGYYNLKWDGSHLASGVYLYTIEAEAVVGSKKFNDVKKMMFLK